MPSIGSTFVPLSILILIAVGICRGDEQCEARLSAVQKALNGNIENRLDSNDKCSTCQGRPGKTGAVGPPGRIGPQGEKGENGTCVCDLRKVEELLEQVKALEDFRKKVSEYQSICYAGISTGAIPLTYVSASSTHPTCSFSDITLNSGAAWCAETNDDDQWVQVDLQKATAIYGVLTRGRRNCGCNQWVTSYKVSYGNRPRRVEFYREKGTVKIFKANFDEGTIVRNTFSRPITARYIRVHPVEYSVHMSMTLELLRC